MATSVAQIETAAQIDHIEQQANAIANSMHFSIPNNTFVYFAGFDGTNNTQFAGVRDPRDVPSGDSINTAVGSLVQQVKVANYTNPNVQALHYDGVGAPGTELGSSVFPTNQSIATAQQAYDDFAKAAHEWLQDHPDGNVTTMITTFSRGSIAGAIFSQMLYENGLVYKDPDGSQTILALPGQIGISAGLIISPVNTGGEGNLAFAPNVANMTVVLAKDEFRSNYAQSVYQQDGFTHLEIDGNHGDSGAIYQPTNEGGDIGAIALQSYTELFRKTNLAVADVSPEHQFDPDAPVYIHDEAFSIATPWNYHYGSLTSNTSLITVPIGQAASGQCTSTGDITYFTDYKGDTVILTSIGNVTQSITTLPKDGGAGTTVNYVSTVSLVSLQNVDGSSTVNACNITGQLLQSTTTLQNGEIDQTTYTNGVSSGVVVTLAPTSDGSMTVYTYDRTGTTVQSSMLKQADGNTVQRIYDGQQQVVTEINTTTDTNGAVRTVVTDNDGASRSRTVNTDGSMTSEYHNADGSHGEGTIDGRGNSESHTFNRDGSGTHSLETSDGARKQEVTAADGTYDEVARLSDGTTYSEHINPDGSSTYHEVDPDETVIDQRNAADGAMTSTTIHVDGTRESAFSNPDGRAGDSRDDGRGNAQSESFGSDGSSATYWEHSDGANGWSQADGKGNLQSAMHDADGVEHTHYEHADGTFGNGLTRPDGTSQATDHAADGTDTERTSLQDGSSTSAFLRPDGSHGESHDDGQGNSRSESVDADGSISHAWRDRDGAYGSDETYWNGSYLERGHDVDGTDHLDIQRADGSSSTSLSRPDGYSYQEEHDVLGSFSTSLTQADGYAHHEDHNMDGSIAESTTNPDGSRSSDYRNADGSYGSSSDDGHGNSQAEAIDVNNGMVSHSWQHSDGTSYEGQTRGNGDYREARREADGTQQTAYSNVDRAHGFSVTHADGSSYSEDHGADNSMTSRTVNADGTTRSTYQYADGAFGYSTTSTDGATLGYAQSADGSYSQSVTDTAGTTTNDYRYANGAYGNEIDRADGTFSKTDHDVDGTDSGAYRKDDGSHGEHHDDHAGNSFAADYFADGRQSESWSAVGGLSGAYTRDAQGNYQESGSTETPYLIIFPATQTFRGGTINADNFTYSYYKNTDGSHGLAYSFEMGASENAIQTDSINVTYDAQGSRDVIEQFFVGDMLEEQITIQTTLDGTYIADQKEISALGLYYEISSNHLAGEANYHQEISWPLSQSTFSEDCTNWFRTGVVYFEDDGFAILPIHLVGVA